jgi:hypothetical protein
LSVAGEITTPGAIVSAGKPFDLAPYDQTFAGMNAANAVLETPGGMQITVTCLADVRPCAPAVHGRWTLRPAFDPIREVVRWTVSRFTPYEARAVARVDGQVAATEKNHKLSRLPKPTSASGGPPVVRQNLR